MVIAFETFNSSILGEKARICNEMKGEISKLRNELIKNNKCSINIDIIK